MFKFGGYEMLCVLIMAGGSGERFWPLSTKEKPKQVLKLFSDKTMILETVDRILPIVPINRIFVATNKVQESIIRENLPDLPFENLILEPLFRDTAAAIGYGTLYIQKHYPNAIITVLASDHIIKEENKFREYIKTAEFQATLGNIVTFGIIPTYPETGYGYIHASTSEIGVPNKVISFREKPNYEKALEYIENGHYLWNSGMFTFSIKTILENFKEHSPAHYQVLEKIKMGKHDLISCFEEFPKLSIDFAIMEKSSNVLVIPISVGWSDVGSFNAFDELFEKNENNSVIRNGKTIEIDSNNNIVVGNNKTVALIGIDDIIVVHTDDAILITKKNQSQRIKEVLKKL